MLAILLKKKTIEVFNFGNHARDFTYIDDIVHGIILVLKSKNVFKPINRIKRKNLSPNISQSCFRIFNIGSGRQTSLMTYIKIIEKNLNIIAKKKYLPLQAGDNKKTHSNTKKLRKILNYRPKVNFRVGVNNFVKWYRDHYSK